MYYHVPTAQNISVPCLFFKPRLIKTDIQLTCSYYLTPYKVIVLSQISDDNQ